MKKTYIKPNASLRAFELCSGILTISNGVTTSAYVDIQKNGLIDYSNNYQEGTGEDAGARDRYDVAWDF